MIRRLLCFLFGHMPASLTLTYARPDGSTFTEPGEMLALTPAPGALPLVMNVCVRCTELVRHHAREAHWAVVFNERAKKAEQIKREAEAEAIRMKRLPGESLKAHALRTRPVPKPLPTGVPPPAPGAK